MNNLSSTAKKLDKVFEIVHIVLGALAIAGLVFIALIGIGYVLGWNPEFLGEGFSSFDVGFLEIEIAKEFSPDPWLILLQAAILLLGACIVIYHTRRGIACIRQILKPMAEEKPFDSIVGANLRKLAKLSIVIGIQCNIILIAEQLVLIFKYDLPGLLLSEKIANVGFNLKVDLSFVIVWAILMLLSYVFRYGEELQQLSDETL